MYIVTHCAQISFSYCFHILEETLYKEPKIEVDNKIEDFKKLFGQYKTKDIISYEYFQILLHATFRRPKSLTQAKFQKLDLNLISKVFTPFL